MTMHQPLKAGNPLLEVIGAADVTAVIAGHLHAYERRERPEAPGVPFLTVGTGGGPATRTARRAATTPSSTWPSSACCASAWSPGGRATSSSTWTGEVRDRFTAPLAP